MTTKEKIEKYAMPNFGVRDFVVSRGKGSYIYDENGEKYLDFGGGIAVMSIGHANPRWVKAVSEQAAKLAHCSNLYLTKEQADLAEKVVSKIGSGKVYFAIAEPKQTKR